MAIQIQLRQGTTTEHNTFKGAVGEVTVDTTKDTLVVHDGVTVGGFPVATRANADGTIELIKKDGTSAGTINATGLFNNTLTSTNTNQALTAAQGKVLKDLIDSSSFGVGQTVQNVTASRALSTTYTNSTNKPILISITVSGGNDNLTTTLTVDGVAVARVSNSNQYGQVKNISYVIPPSSTYSVTGSPITLWTELR